MASVFDVARYIMECLERRGEHIVTTWKLQKLVYYAQAWSLVWDDEPLFEEPIQAWVNGPVCPELYCRHRGLFKISKGSIGGNIDNLTSDQRETIDIVVKHYGSRSAHYLSSLTHQEAPWREARKGLSPGERGDKVITLDSMAEYYGGIVETEEGSTSCPA